MEILLLNIRKVKITDCTISERHLRNHGGDPTLLQENFKYPEQDYIPYEFV